MSSFRVLVTGFTLWLGTGFVPVALPASPAPDADASRSQMREVKSIAASLRPAIADAMATFGDAYPEGAKYLDRLDALARRVRRAAPETRDALLTAMRALQREALVANPLVGGQPLLFVVRRQYRSDHHNTATMFQTGEINTGSFTGGGALKTTDLRTGQVTTLLDLPKGVARDPELSFDGKTVLFSMRRDIKDDYHVYEIGVDGHGLRQLTFGSGVSDIDPLYLADDRIAFTSTREPKYCMCNRHIMGNLFRMDADGSNIHQIGHSTLHEGHGVLTPDGQILYDRWEYIDRNFGDAQGVWTCNPDGTNHAVYFGNNTKSPGGILDARVIGRTERFISTFSSCHDRPWGALAIVDRGLGVDGKPPVLRTWPASAMKLVMTGNYDRFKAVQPKYEDPYPLGDAARGAAEGSTFLCARQVQGEQMGIFCIDLFGNEVLLHTEAPGCFDPMPVAPRTRPIHVPDRTDLARQLGTFYIYDVYNGTGMDRIPRGTVKFLRVVESPEKRFWTQPAWNGSGTQAPGMAWNDFNNKRILGTVPVEDDGSAHFAVPADRYIYFQLLDEKGMMVQSMRSGTITRPGETTGCVGCHDQRHSAVPNSRKKALSRPPSPLAPWYGEERLFNYLTEVQPVFDRYCVKCHDYGKPAGEKLVLAGDLTLSFNASYMELRRRNLVRVVGAGPPEIQSPRSWGSHGSRLVEVLLAKHQIREDAETVDIDPESFTRIVTWIDINAPYYASYASAYPGNLHGRSPLDGGQLQRLSALTGVQLNRQHAAPQISFTRPALSPCLARLKAANDPNYPEALAIIQTGKEQLARRPRMDMPGAQLFGVEVTRQEKYERLLREEALAREAIAHGEKVRPEP